MRGVPGGPQPQPGEGAAPLDQPPRSWGLTQHRMWWPHPRPYRSCRVPALPTALPHPASPFPGPHGAASLQRLPDHRGTCVGRGWPSLKPCGVRQAMTRHAGGSPRIWISPLMTEGGVFLPPRRELQEAHGVCLVRARRGSCCLSPACSLICRQGGLWLPNGVSKGWLLWTQQRVPCRAGVPGAGLGGPWQTGWRGHIMYKWSSCLMVVGLGDGCWPTGVTPAQGSWGLTEGVWWGGRAPLGGWFLGGVGPRGSTWVSRGEASLLAPIWVWETQSWHRQVGCVARPRSSLGWVQPWSRP